ncbi:MAG: hypothetical protein C5B49_02455 [Bdellovibrio sp.]|nr:MAG: hypothetical protein C5B49_02455 [Bdellovibrio sp.]
MSIKIIQERLNQYSFQNQLQEENALKEIAQEIALSALSRAGFFKVAAFQGGTCLRILYGLNRFSEDLDFALQKPSSNFRWETYLKNMKAELEAYGFQFQVVERDKSGAVKSVFLKENSIGNLLLLSHRNQSSRLIKIKLEIDTDPPKGAKIEQKYINFPITVPVISHDLASLFAGKSHALLCRPYIKGRDWFDFVWYVSRKTPINFELLSHALNQLGPWKEKRVRVDNRWYAEELSKKIKNTNWNQQKKDVERFLRPEDLDLLNQWRAGFFLDRLMTLIPTFQVRVSVHLKNGKTRSYIEGEPFYYEKDQALQVGKKAFSKTKNVAMVEVFQSGIARPIGFFQ